MIDGQLGRRNLTPIQRVAVTEKYRPVFEDEANKNKQIAAQKMNNTFSADLPKTISPVDTRKELAKLAGVGERTYGKATACL